MCPCVLYMVTTPLEGWQTGDRSPDGHVNGDNKPSTTVALGYTILGRGESYAAMLAFDPVALAVSEFCNQ